MPIPLNTQRNSNSFAINDPPASVIASSKKLFMLQNQLNHEENKLKKPQNNEAYFKSNDFKRTSTLYPISYKGKARVNNFKLSPSYSNNYSGNRPLSNMNLLNKNNRNYYAKIRQANSRNSAKFKIPRNINEISQLRNFENRHTLLAGIGLEIFPNRRHAYPTIRHFIHRKHAPATTKHSKIQVSKIQNFASNAMKKELLAMKRIRSVSSQNIEMKTKAESKYILFASVCVPVLVAVLFCFWKMRKTDDRLEEDKFKYDRLKNYILDNNSSYEKLDEVEKSDAPEFSFKSCFSNNYPSFPQTDLNLSYSGTYSNFDVSEQKLVAKNRYNNDCHGKLVEIPPIDLLTYNGYMNKNERLSYGKTCRIDHPPSVISTFFRKEEVLNNQSHESEIHSSRSVVSSVSFDVSYTTPPSLKKHQSRYMGVINSADLDSSRQDSSCSSLVSVSNSDYIKGHQFEYENGFYASDPFLLKESFEPKASFSKKSSLSDTCLPCSANESPEEKVSLQPISNDFSKSGGSFESASESIDATAEGTETWTYQGYSEVNGGFKKSSLDFSDSSSSESSFYESGEIIEHAFVS